jgi:NAD(P)-dependent dehydrogenase (short-subunit alcohol dehydrogenase family)
MMRALRITSDHLHRFAAASGDQNPLHTDAGFARASPYGRPIAQGALVTIAALSVAEADALEHVDGLQVQFKQAVLPDEDYATTLLASDSEGGRIEVRREGRVAVSISWTVDRDASLPEAVSQRGASLRAAPDEPSLEALAAGDASFEEPYAADLDALDALADELGAGHVPRTLMLWLAAASYTVGMIVPGRDAVFVAAWIARSSSERAGLLEGSVTTVDERIGLVNVDVELHEAEASARVTLQTFLRPPVPPPDRTSIGGYLPPSSDLSGRNVLVVGASRGLGAALAGALATQGARVWAGFSRSAAHVEGLRSEFGAEAIQPLQFDATDVSDVRRAFVPLRERETVLDGIVLAAAPSLYETGPLHPDASESTVGFVDESLAQTLFPLAETLPMLAPDGWVVILSSSALEDPPEAWPHYVIAKSAVEGVAAYCRRVTRARVLIARPPTMWTDSTNTPLARLTAVPKEQVAASIVRWVVSGDSGVGLLSGRELVEAVPERPPS